VRRLAEAGLIHRDAGDWYAGSCGGPDGARQVTLAECGWASRHGDNPLNHKLWRKSGRLGESLVCTASLCAESPDIAKCWALANVGKPTSSRFPPATPLSLRTTPRAGRTTGRLWAIAGWSRLGVGGEF
jgi:hypothetical protein